MSKVLYIQASPRTERSWSRGVADAFVDAYLERHPDDEVETMDLFIEGLPPFDETAAQGKYNIMHGQEGTPEEKAAWEPVESVIAKFIAADKYVFAVPMWNFGIPYILKQYIDLIVQPTYTFSFSPDEGYTGLVTGKPALVIYARGGEYEEGTPAASMDFQQRYLETVLNFIGFIDVRSVKVEPTLQGGPETAAAQKEKAVARVREMADSF